jgi:NAD+ kinase
MKNFGLYFNPYYHDNGSVIRVLKSIKKQYGINYFKTTDENNLPSYVSKLAKVNNSELDCILVFGGDGTMLKAAGLSLEHKVPLLGINLGKMGFLSDSNLKELEKSIHELVHNRYKIQKRMILKVSLKRANKLIYSGLAINDAVVFKGEEPKLIEIKVYCNRRYVLETRCDGVLAATPTGSTAYSLAAGGPILSPVMEAIIFAPLSPHILSVRPMVFSSKDQLAFKIRSIYENAILQIDGKNEHELVENDEIIVAKAPQKVEFIKLSNKTFYQILRKKLHMGRR